MVLEEKFSHAGVSIGMEGPVRFYVFGAEAVDHPEAAYGRVRITDLRMGMSFHVRVYSVVRR
jgi:hypothetical protein